MIYVFSSGQVYRKLELAMLSDESNISREIELVKSAKELNNRLAIQSNGQASVIIFSEAIYAEFGNDPSLVKSYLFVINSLEKKFRLIYITPDTRDDAVAKYLVDTGVNDIIAQPPSDRINPAFIMGCVTLQSDFSAVSEIVNLRESGIATIVSAYKYLIDTVYSNLGSSSLTKLLQEFRPKFLDIEFKLADFAGKVEAAENTLRLKDTQLSFYAEKIKEFEDMYSNAKETMRKILEKSEQKDSQIAYLTLQNNEIQKRQEEVIESLNKNTDSMIYYTTKDTDILHSDLAAVIVFKEYTYSRYFNTFIKYLLRFMSSTTKGKKAYKTRVVIFDQNLDNSGVIKFKDFMLCNGTEYVGKLSEKDLLITTEVRSDFMRSIVEPGSGYEVVIVIDRRKNFNEDMYKGIRVCRFSVANSSMDAKVFNIDKSTLVSSGISDAGIVIPTIGAFSAPSKSEQAEYMQYKNTAIKSFMEKLEYIGISLGD